MSPFNASYDALVAKTLQRWHIPGAAISVVQGDHTWSKGYGVSQRPQVPVTPSTLFYVCSTTKAQLCATWAIYLESDENCRPDGSKRIQWSTPLCEIIRDDFVLEDAVATNLITLEDALSHRSGMARHEASYGRGHVLTVKDVTRNLRNLPMHTSPRSSFEYCNTMYVAASHALEVVTGKTVAQMMRQSLWGSLGMTETYADIPEAVKAVEDGGAVLATGHIWTKLPGAPGEAEGELVEVPPMHLAAVSGAGFVISTVDDYAKWMRALLARSGPLTVEIVDELWSPRSIPGRDWQTGEGPYDGPIVYCLGWAKATYRGQEVIWHPGGVSGAGSMVMLLPQQRWGVTIFANGHDTSTKLKSLAFALMDELLGTPIDERVYERVNHSALQLYLEAAEKQARARDRLFPTAPAASTPPSLPIADYSGTFKHPGYGSITFEVQADDEGDYMYCHIKSTFDRRVKLRHINAEHWLGIFKSGKSPLESALRARTRLGVDGKVMAWEIAMEPAMPDTMMIFERCS